METSFAVGKPVIRLDAAEKVAGRAKFNNDEVIQGVLHCKLVTSKYAHAKIKSIDVSDAANTPGVKAIITGGDTGSVLTGTFLEDRPIMAIDKVRYFGEPIAAVIADTELAAERAVQKVTVEYEPLPVINSVSDALASGAALVHEDLQKYRKVKEVFPAQGTNVAHHVKIRKGDMEQGWAKSEVIVEGSYMLPQSDHVAMETRSVRAEIKPDGQLVIHSTSQGPFIIRKKISRHLGIDLGKITVYTPVVGGSFGGKSAVQLEFIAYFASKAVGGKEVLLVNSREDDMVSSPCRIGLEAKVKFGASRDGIINAAEITYHVETGAYSDMGAVMTKACASDGTGPYNIDNVWCDSKCVYTNHPYVTSFRGFGHSEFTMAIERTMDKLADALGMDPWELRLKNAIKPGDTTPTQVKLTHSNIGDLPKCIEKVKALINWDEGRRIEVDNNKVRAKGVACLWKTSSTPTDAVSGAVITFSADGYANLNIGAVELGQGSRTTFAQLTAERLKMDTSKVNVNLVINTTEHPEHWKTVASTATYMVGNAIITAADDAIAQIKDTAAVVLRCSKDDLDVAGGRVFLKGNPEKYLDITEVIHGYMYPNGNSIGGQIIGRGGFVVKHLSPMDKDTGKGHPGPLWTVGAQAVEVELDKRDYSYTILKAASVMDVGKVINPMMAKGVAMSGMAMGLSTASREAFEYDNTGVVTNPNLRTYKLMRYGEHPEYLVEFVETPDLDGPFGARGFGEHGVVGIPGALMNSLCTAAGTELDRLPLTPELIWKTVTEDWHDHL